MSRVLLLALCSLAAMVLGPASSREATAGTFTMRQCEGALFDDFQGRYGALNGSRQVLAVSGCEVGGPGKIGIYQDRGGTSLSFGAGGRFAWSAPDDLAVIGTRFSARLNDANAIRAELLGYDGSGFVDLDEGVEHDGEKRQSSWGFAENPQKMIIARLSCDSLRDCPNSPNGRKAYLEVTDAEFTVRDTAPPVVAPSGELWDWGDEFRFHRGEASVTVGARDRGSGVAAAWAEVNGLRVAFPAPHCPGDRGSYSTRFTPCPSAHGATRGFDTTAAPFREGVNRFRLCARDYADTEAGASKRCSGLRAVLIDNRPSDPPVDLRAEEGTGWRPRNGFTLRWDIPNGQAAPVVGAVYRLVEISSGERVAAGYFGGVGLTSAGPVEVPAVGAYRASIELVDGAGNLGEPAETILRFDDRPPGDVSPQPAAGWISRDELPLDQVVEEAVPGGPSGISGYALAVSKDGPAEPCGGAICLAPEITLAGGPDLRTGSIGGLAEGSHWVSAAAVSGANRSSLEPGSTLVRVDRTPPVSTISGIPNEWVDRPVVITVQARDRISGMQPVPGDEGRPKTVIHAGDHAPYASPGAGASFAVASEGVNRIRYWAEDLAGNANDGMPAGDGGLHAAPGRAVVRIDTTPPRVSFDPARSPKAPERVRVFARDTDSGVVSASIGIRKAGSNTAFKALPTTGKGGVFHARVPSDSMARGAWELRASVEDRASNRGVGNQTTSGGPMILKLPLKRRVALTAGFGRGRSVLRSRYGSRRFVAGRLFSGDRALPNLPVSIVETFLPGSRRRPVRTRLRTDGDGRYRLRLARGPSRNIEVAFGGTSRLSRARGPRLKLRVRAGVAFRIKPRKVFNGGAVRMIGSVGFRGALPPARGKLVAIQYFDPTRRKWRPAELLRTGRRGRFRYLYRFRTITTAQRIIFRANVLPEAGWPYLPSTSKPRSVIVFPRK